VFAAGPYPRLFLAAGLLWGSGFCGLPTGYGATMEFHFLTRIDGHGLVSEPNMVWGRAVILRSAAPRSFYCSLAHSWRPRAAIPALIRGSMCVLPVLPALSGPRGALVHRTPSILPPSTTPDRFFATGAWWVPRVAAGMAGANGPETVGARSGMNGVLLWAAGLWVWRDLSIVKRRPRPGTCSAGGVG